MEREEKKAQSPKLGKYRSITLKSILREGHNAQKYTTHIFFFTQALLKASVDFRLSNGQIFKGN